MSSDRDIHVPMPEAEEVARFAVEQYNQKQNAKIKFVRVVDRPKAQLGAGVEYHIALEVDHAGKMLHCEAEAHYRPWMKQLMKFQQRGGSFSGVDSDLPSYEPAVCPYVCVG